MATIEELKAQIRQDLDSWDQALSQGDLDAALEYRTAVDDAHNELTRQAVLRNALREARDELDRPYGLEEAERELREKSRKGYEFLRNGDLEEAERVSFETEELRRKVHSLRGIIGRLALADAVADAV